MNNTNYWNQMSGDSQASNWNQDNWARGQRADHGGGFLDNLKYGAETTEGAGTGWWSGGRPGAGSWMEAMKAVEPVKPAATPDNSGMVAGAPAQVPSRSPAVADTPPPPSSYSGPWDYANFDWQAYAAANPDVLATNYGGGNTWGNALDQMWHHYTSANQSGENRAYIGYHGGRVNPYTGTAQNAGSYVGPAASNWSARVAPAAPVAAPTNPWISGGGSGRMNIRQF